MKHYWCQLNLTEIPQSLLHNMHKMPCHSESTPIF